jgi:hypothetical protein
MKRFLTNLLLMVLLVCLALTAIVSFDFLVMGNQYTQAYTGSILDKTARMAAIQEPKILLVGNSNLSFGMDSARLEEATGMPVVNLGLHGGLGNAFHEELAKSYIRQGDIVILCHSDYASDGIGDNTLAWVTLEKHTDLWHILRPEDIPKFLRAYPEYFLNVVKNWLSHSDVPLYDSCYARAAFNEYGDIVVRPRTDAAHHEFTPGSVTLPMVDDTNLNRMNAFHDYVRSQGATLLLSYYPIAWGEYTPQEDAYLAIQDTLRSRLTFPIISDIRDYFIPYEYFYDTIYHLNEEGVAIRTGQLAEDLLAWMETNPEVSK